MITNNSQNFYINSQDQLGGVIDLIKKTKLVALDTEFTRETTYYPILSIIQVALKNSSNSQELFIIDCLSGINLEEFFTVIADVKIIKILHSSTQDLQIFNHKSNLLPQGIIDTQIMANFCGFDFSVGYSNLVENFFQKSLSKDQQRSDWQLRPLSARQIEYALLDVVFLQEIYEKLLQTLIAQNRFDWFLQEMQSFVTKTLNKSDEILSKNFSWRNKSPKQIAQIKKLTLWREDWARKINVPRQHFMKDEVIEKLVTNQRINTNFSQEIREQIDKIFDTKEENFDKNFLQEKDFFMTAKQKNIYLEAKKLINKICLKENFKEQFLITSYSLKKVICRPEIFKQKITGWRYEIFGKELEELIRQN